MIRIEPKTDFVELEAIGTLNSDDYEGFVPEMERLVARRGPLRLLITLTDFHGWTPAGLGQDIKFDVQHQDEMDRVAVVGENKVQEWGTRLSKPFLKAEMRYFTPEQRAEAERWLRQ